MAEKPSGWKSLTGGEVNDSSDKTIFGQPFNSEVVEHGNAVASTIEAANGGGGGASGIFSAETITIESGTTLTVEDALILFASDEITIKADAMVDGRGNGGAGASDVMVENIGVDKPIHPEIPSARFLETPKWLGRGEQSDDTQNGDDDTNNDDNDTDNGDDSDTPIDDILDIFLTSTTATPASTTVAPATTLPSDGNTTTDTANPDVGVSEGVGRGIRERMKDYFDEVADDIEFEPPGENSDMARGGVPVNQAVPSGVSLGGVSDVTLPMGESGMLGEHDFFSQIDSKAGWLEQMYILAQIDVHIRFEDKPRLLGGRGGTAGIIEPGFDSVRPYFDSVLNSTSSDSETGYTTPYDTVQKSIFEGGDGGAAVILIAPKVRVEEGATVNLQGDVPRSLRPHYLDVLKKANFGAILPERGRAGRFGVVSNDYNIHESAIMSHGGARPAIQGGIGGGG